MSRFMSYINRMIFESLFRVRNDMSKFKPSVLAYMAIHGQMPPRHLVYNGATKNRLFGDKLYDYNLDPQWIHNLNDSNFITGEFKISGGFNEDNVSFISFDKELTQSDKLKLNKLKSIPNTFIQIDKTHYSIPKIVITSPYYYDKDSVNDNREWRNWWDSITSALKDM